MKDAFCVAVSVRRMLNEFIRVLAYHRCADTNRRKDKQLGNTSITKLPGCARLYMWYNRNYHTKEKVKAS